MLDSLVRVSRRAAYSHYASILADARTSVQAGGMSSPLYVHPERWYVSETFIPPPKLMLALFVVKSLSVIRALIVLKCVTLSVL